MLQASGKVVWMGGDFHPLLRVSFASLEGGELQFYHYILLEKKIQA